MAKKAKKQRKKLDFSKAKKVMSNIFKICGRVSMVTLGIASLGAFLVIPFLHNYIDHTWAQWIWYPACAIFVVSAVIDSHSTNKKPGKIPLFDFFEKLSLLPAIMIFGSAFIINYYNVAFSWWWAGFVIFAVYFPVFMFGIRKYLEKEKSYTPEQIKKSKKNCLKYVLFYWLIDLFYMSIFNYWQTSGDSQKIWFVLQFIFGGLAMVYIFYNLTRVFLANGEKHWWGLLQDFIFGIAITIYLIYLMPSTNGLQNVVSTIIAAVYGGLLTLVGVAWTIKSANDDKKKELTLQNKPILYAHMMDMIDALKLTPIELLFIDLKKIKSNESSKSTCEASSDSQDEPLKVDESKIKAGGTITLKSLVNTDNSIVLIKKIMVNDIELTPLNNNIIAKNKAYNLILHVPNITDKDKIKLYVEDVLHNPYCFAILPYVHEDKKGNIHHGIMRIEECKSEESNE